MERSQKQIVQLRDYKRDENLEKEQVQLHKELCDAEPDTPKFWRIFDRLKILMGDK